MKILSPFLILLALISSTPGWAGTGFEQIQSYYNVGMASVSYSETATALKGDTGSSGSGSSSSSSSSGAAASSSSEQQTASGAVSVMPLQVGLEFFRTSNRSYYVAGLFPAMGNGSDRYMEASGGVNIYMFGPASLAAYQDAVGQIKIKPVWRFFYGFGLDTGYLVYTTKTAKKSDIMVAINAHAGAGHAFSARWGVRGEFDYGRAVGVATNSMIMKMFLGLTYYLDI